MFVIEKIWDDLVIKGVKELLDRLIVDIEGVFILIIYFNFEFWSLVFFKLEVFYNEYIFVEFVYL